MTLAMKEKLLKQEMEKIKKDVNLSKNFELEM